MNRRAPPHSLNAIAPYFTMFPIGYPLKVIEDHSKPGDLVLDPFCGRGTTNYAARLLGRDTYGIDCNPMAIAVARAKMVNPSPGDIVEEARSLLKKGGPVSVPRGEFWELAFHPEILRDLAILRKGLLRSSRSDERRALTAIILGALHGPLNKGSPSYFSNQCPRTFAPKPAYAVKFWRERGLSAPSLDVLEVIKNRAARYYGEREAKVSYTLAQGDSRQHTPYARLAGERRADLVVTSPPYPGMVSYYTDQWLRNWFLGGAAHVDYSMNKGIVSASPERFVAELREVWTRAAEYSTNTATLVCRFGVLPSFQGSKREMIVASFRGTPWRVRSIHDAGSARSGRRIANTFQGEKPSEPNVEIDVVCRKR